MSKICSKEELQSLADDFDLKRSGTKKELIQQITSHPDFELDDIQRAFYKEELQDICRNRGLPVSGSKYELWEQIVEDFNIVAPKPERKTLPTGEKRTIILTTVGRQRRPRTITKSQIPTYQEETQKGNAILYEVEAYNADEAREIINKGGLWKVSYGKGVIYSNAQSMEEISLVQAETLTITPIPAPQEPITLPTPAAELKEPDKSHVAVINAINEWIPAQRYRNEEGYQAELASFLEHKHRFSIKREAGPSLADILVGGKYPIELKKDPKRTDLDRLLAQVIRHIENYNTCIVVICEPKARDLLIEYQRRIEGLYAEAVGEVIFIHK